MNNSKKFDHKWGFEDSRFEVTSGKSVILTGDRYALSGYEISKLIGFVVDNFQIELALDSTKAEIPSKPVPPPNINKQFLASLESYLKPDQVTLEDSTLSTLATTGLPGGDGITMDTERNVYLCEWTNDAVYRYDSTFTVGPTLFSTGHNDPADIYFDRVNSVLAVPNFSANTVDFVPVIPSAVDEGADGGLPQSIRLHQNCPNPFNPATQIAYDLTKATHVSLKVFDLLGREVRTLMDEVQPVGSHSVFFDGSRLASGIYLYHLQAGAFTTTKKMVLLK